MSNQRMSKTTSEYPDLGEVEHCEKRHQRFYKRLTSPRSSERD